MSGVRRQGTPSPSNGALARPSGCMPSSVSVTTCPATCSPTRPANSERPFCTASAVSAEESTPKNEAATNGSSTTVVFVVLGLVAPSRSTARVGGLDAAALRVEVGRLAADGERQAGLDLAVLLAEHVGVGVAVALAEAAAHAARVGEEHLGVAVGVHRFVDRLDARVGGQRRALDGQRQLDALLVGGLLRARGRTRRPPPARRAARAAPSRDRGRRRRRWPSGRVDDLGERRRRRGRRCRRSPPRRPGTRAGPRPCAAPR